MRMRLLGMTAAVFRAVQARPQIEAALKKAQEAAKKVLEKAASDFKNEVATFYPIEEQKLRQGCPQVTKAFLTNLGKKYGRRVPVEFNPDKTPEWGEAKKSANPLLIERVIKNRNPPDGIKAANFTCLMPRICSRRRS